MSDRQYLVIIEVTENAHSEMISPILQTFGSLIRFRLQVKLSLANVVHEFLVSMISFHRIQGCRNVLHIGGQIISTNFCNSCIDRLLGQ